jgi:hypothetical protein
VRDQSRPVRTGYLGLGLICGIILPFMGFLVINTHPLPYKLRLDSQRDKQSGLTGCKLVCTPALTIFNFQDGFLYQEVRYRELPVCNRVQMDGLEAVEYLKLWDNWRYHRLL